MADERKNAGYDIIASVRFDENYEVVLGERTSDNGDKAYVTWECNYGNYYYGHYITDKLSAIMDFGERVKDKAELYISWQKDEHNVDADNATPIKPQEHNHEER